MTMKQEHLSVDEVRSLLTYCGDTGELRWRVGRAAGKIAGYTQSNGYVRVRVAGVQYYAHRLVWLIVYGEWPPQLDHRDCNRANNAIGNLRVSTQAQNRANSRLPVTSTSKLKGVTQMGRKWAARIKHQYRTIHLGCFDTPDEAHTAYLAAAQEHFGDFARAA